MTKMKMTLLAALLAVTVGACEKAEMKMIRTECDSADQVWLCTVDAVSNYLRVDRVDKEKGIIEARSDGLWQRNLARLEVHKSGGPSDIPAGVGGRGQYEILVGVYTEATKVLTRPSGMRVGEEAYVIGVNADLRDTLVREIEGRLKRMKTAPIAAVPSGSAPPKKQ
jgi:hypothetical protein